MGKMLMEKMLGKSVDGEEGVDGEDVVEVAV